MKYILIIILILIYSCSFKLEDGYIDAEVDVASAREYLEESLTLDEYSEYVSSK